MYISNRFVLACSLAMGETLLQFEHRDLHMSNIMVKHTRDKVYTYEVAATSCDVTDRDNCGACRKTKQVTVDTKGIKLTIIDYTLSRLLVQGQVSSILSLPFLFFENETLKFTSFFEKKH